MTTLPLPLRPTVDGGRARITLKTGLPPGAIPYLVFLDFDKTITTEDSLDLLAQVSASVQQDAAQSQYVMASWEACKEAYLKDYVRFNEQYHTKKMHRITLQQEIEYQRALRQVELDSTLRVSERALFELPKRPKFNVDWYSAGRVAVNQGFLKIRPGFVDFINALEARNVNEMLDDHSNWGIISINFCQQFVSGAVEAALPKFENWARVGVLANEIDEQGRIVPSECTLGGERTRLLSSIDKCKAMREMQTWGAQEHAMTIYIGDSLTDLECLTEAKIGICMYTNDGGPLKETFDRMGYIIPHISKYRESEKEKWYWANNFQDIVESRLMRPWLALSPNEQFVNLQAQYSEGKGYTGPTTGEWDQRAVGYDKDSENRRDVSSGVPSLPFQSSSSLGTRQHIIDRDNAEDEAIEQRSLELDAELAVEEAQQIPMEISFKEALEQTMELSMITAEDSRKANLSDPLNDERGKTKERIDGIKNLTQMTRQMDLAPKDGTKR